MATSNPHLNFPADKLGNKLEVGDFIEFKDGSEVITGQIIEFYLLSKLPTRFILIVAPVYEKHHNPTKKVRPFSLQETLSIYSMDAIKIKNQKILKILYGKTCT